MIDTTINTHNPIMLTDRQYQKKYRLITDYTKNYPKYFYDIYTNTYLIYSQSSVSIISQQQTKTIDLGNRYAIIKLTYNPYKNTLLIQNYNKNLLAYFIRSKKEQTIKKELKRQQIFSWIYNNNNFDLLIVNSKKIKLYKVDEDKNNVKQIKIISCKYLFFLYQPSLQYLVCFPTCDNNVVDTFIFDSKKICYQGPSVNIYFDQNNTFNTYKNQSKNVNFKSSNLFCSIFQQSIPQQIQINIIPMNNKCYIVFSLHKQQQFKLISIDNQQCLQKITIKFNSLYLHSFHVVDNMLVIHDNKQQSTFVYDINGNHAQLLAQPFSIKHKTRDINPYHGVFISNIHIMPNGNISRCQISVQRTLVYLRNQMQIFEYLIKRKDVKREILKWLRYNLLKIKPTNLSRYWRMILSRFEQKNQNTNKCNVNNNILNQIYLHVFYPVSVKQQTPKQQFMNIILECIRQAKCKYQMSVEFQKLLVSLLLKCKNYQMLVFLFHVDIIREREQFVDQFIIKATTEHLQILITLAIDMAMRVCRPPRILQILVTFQRVWLARRYMRQNYQRIPATYMISAGRQIKDDKIRNEYNKLIRAFVFEVYPKITDKDLDQSQQYFNIAKNNQKKTTNDYLQNKILDKQLQENQHQEKLIYSLY